MPTGSWQNIAFGDGVFVAVSADFGNYAATSPDGITWTVRTLAAAVWNPLAYGNSRFVTINDDSLVSVSTNAGVTWSTPAALPTGTATDWYDLTYGNGLFVAVGMEFSSGSGSPCIITSPDGVTWTTRTSPVIDLRGVTFGGDRFVAIPQNNSAFVASLDGINWESASLGYTAISTGGAIGYGGGLFVVNSTRTDTFINHIITSTDGFTWVEGQEIVDLDVRSISASPTVRAGWDPL
jgi:hypothetical protein